MNDKLEEIGEKDITFEYRTFQNYKAAYFKEESTNGKIPRISKGQRTLFEMFFRVIKKNLVRQKQALFQ